MRRQSLLAAVLVAASACGVEQQDPRGSGSSGSELNLGDKDKPLPDRDCRQLSVRPMATGTLRALPELDAVDVAPVGAAVQSMFTSHPSAGAESRHGVVEFQLPALGGHITRAELSFSDVHGYVLQPVPGDVHVLRFHSVVDGVVSVDDWVREGEPFTMIVTDLNELNPPPRRFDVLGEVRLGGTLGVRIDLQRGSLPSGTYGSAFDGFRVDLTVCGEGRLPDGQPIGEPIF